MALHLIYHVGEQTIGPMTAAVQTQSYPIDMNNNFIVHSDIGALWMMFPIPVIENTIQRTYKSFGKLIRRFF
jgi:hypothetical protein